ncbi:hypothetical protein ABZY14_07875 [Streptomyces sp. NPDC006617]|uniref:hypothetical protein n=1 Tax=Streptomyces sp. NPDC006617 TaxID=3155354 RepID=UPI0033BEB131
MVDMARTGLNVTGNSLAALVIAKSEGRFTARDKTAGPSASGRRSDRGRRPPAAPATPTRPPRRHRRTPGDCDRARATAARGARAVHVSRGTGDPRMQGCDRGVLRRTNKFSSSFNTNVEGRVSPGDHIVCGNGRHHGPLARIGHGRPCR